ncbi:MAG: isoprenyl transferase [Firmicutes bacterium]|nr:isoprenyl transferase [Bacillota bacterium]
MDLTRLPAHVAIVMDGNGRWAKMRNKPRLFGHNEGMEALIKIVRAASDIGISYLTVYAFSTENWKRPLEEVSGIFRLLLVYIERELAELHRNNVKLRILGDWKNLDPAVVKTLENALETTKDNTGLQFCIALNYGGRNELVHSVRALAEKAAAGELKPEEITEEMISQNLYAPDVPDPDLVIRTSGEIRLSNFLLWQSAYSELVFTDVLWPDFTPECLEEAITEYQSRSRLFGGARS